MLSHMINGTGPTQSVHGALARLDQDIAEAEERLTALRAMRQNVELFIDKYADAPPPTSGTEPSPQPTNPESLVEHIAAVFEQHPDENLDTDQVMKILHHAGRDAGRESVRTGLYYLARKDRISKVDRGKFARGG